MDWNQSFDKCISALIRSTLTIVEASYDDAEQRDAVKTLMRRAIYNEMDYLRDILVKDYNMPDKGE
jgi:hypothetical protein